MRIYLMKQLGSRLAPADEASQDVIRQWTAGEVVAADIKRPRNAAFHRKFFALLNVVYQNTDKYESIEDLLVEVKLRTGHYREHITADGEVVYVPKSIAFANMSEDAFGRFYQKALTAIIERILPGIKPDNLEEAVMDALAFA